MKYGFLGGGNMGSAIFKGMSKSLCQKKDIFVYDVNVKRLNELKDDGFNVCNNYDEIINNVDVLFLSVKPNVFPLLLKSISDLVKVKKPLLVSIAAGIEISKIEDYLGFKTPIIRVMPNINAQIGMSTSAYCLNDLANDNHRKIVEDCFNSIGYITEISESQFSVFSAIASCSPAYVYMFINALAKAGVKNGMPKDKALAIVANTVMGSAKMVLDSNKHPMELTDMVCSPGGTTIEGVVTLDEYNFDYMITKAVDNSIIKDQKLGK